MVQKIFMKFRLDHPERVPNAGGYVKLRFATGQEVFG